MKHCWHKTGFEQPMSPPNIQHQCCYCGKMEWVETRYMIKEGHGDFFKVRVLEIKFPDDECPNRIEIAEATK